MQLPALVRLGTPSLVRREEVVVVTAAAAVVLGLEAGGLLVRGLTESVSSWQAGQTVSLACPEAVADAVAALAALLVSNAVTVMRLALAQEFGCVEPAVAVVVAAEVLVGLGVACACLPFHCSAGGSGASFSCIL